MHGDRRAVRPGERDEPRVEHVDGVWRLRDARLIRTVLRMRDATTQAGFTAEAIPADALSNHPILFSDGPGHDAQRKELGRFLAPSVVAARHLPDIEAFADGFVAEAAAKREFDLDDMALHFTVQVTARIVGLTASDPRPMARRLVTFFNQPPFDVTRKDLGRTRRQWAQAAWNGLWPVLRFHLADVRPAIRERRRNPGDDIISHLLEAGYSDLEILVEAATYGTAGMVTTREFIVMAAWHLLGDDDLRAHYLEAGQQERWALLNEVIRLEPVVGHLYRRAQSDIPLPGTSHVVRAGDLLDLHIRQANADADTVGAEPLRLRPGRPLPRGVNEAVLSFGDGHHKCPGQPLAIAEADALLFRLLARGPAVVAEPALGWDDLVSGYTLRGLRLRLP